jgi:hypothetical protein
MVWAKLFVERHHVPLVTAVSGFTNLLHLTLKCAINTSLLLLRERERETERERQRERGRERQRERQREGSFCKQVWSYRILYTQVAQKKLAVQKQNTGGFLKCDIKRLSPVVFFSPSSCPPCPAASSLSTGQRSRTGLCRTSSHQCGHLCVKRETS